MAIPKGFKHSEETKKKMSKSRKGKSGKYIRTDNIKEKNRLANTGRKHTLSARKGMSVGQLKRVWTDEQKTEFRLSRSGEKSPRWKGGKNKLSMSIRKCFKYRQWRSDVYTRDDFTCQVCSIRGGNLEAHHIKQFIDIINDNNIKTVEEALLCEELWNINNGQTLCVGCHNITKHKNT